MVRNFLTQLPAQSLRGFLGSRIVNTAVHKLIGKLRRTRFRLFRRKRFVTRIKYALLLLFALNVKYNYVSADENERKEFVSVNIAVSTKIMERREITRVSKIVNVRL